MYKIKNKGMKSIEKFLSIISNLHTNFHLKKT